MDKFIFYKFTRVFFSLLLVGTFIGFLHSYDALVAVTLFILLIYRLYSEIKNNPSEKKAFILISGNYTMFSFRSFSRTLGNFK